MNIVHHVFNVQAPPKTVCTAINSLRLFCEQGEGTPYRSGISGARVGATTVD